MTTPGQVPVAEAAERSHLALRRAVVDVAMSLVRADHPPRARPYPRGSWGPEEMKTMLRGHPRWQQPWLPEKG